MVDYVISTGLPLYSEARAIIKFLDGKSVAEINTLRETISKQQRNSKINVNWADPDTWISEILTDRAQELARELWENSNGVANPRRIFPSSTFASLHELLQQRGQYTVTKEGNDFINEQDAAIKTADSKEGIDFILNKIKEQQPCRRADILEAWGKFLVDANFKVTVRSFIDALLGGRFANLLQRGLIARKGTAYVVTENGTAYLQSISKFSDVEKDKILEQVGKLRESINTKLLANISGIETETFTKFVADLLTRMGYENAEVTRYSNDGGIDITAKKVDGLTEINYVFEVKRQQNDIQKNEINEFAGEMGGIKRADVGVFITTGKFSDAAKETVENLRDSKIITLIDGDGLIELIREHNIGIEKETIELYDIDKAYFQQDFSQYSYIEDSSGTSP